jgi:hypothetical protein
MLKPISLRKIYITRLNLHGVINKEIGKSFGITGNMARIHAHKTIERLLNKKRPTIDGVSYQEMRELSRAEIDRLHAGPQRNLRSMRDYKKYQLKELLEKLTAYEKEHYPLQRKALEAMDTLEEVIALVKELSK